MAILVYDIVKRMYYKFLMARLQILSVSLLYDAFTHASHKSFTHFA